MIRTRYDIEADWLINRFCNYTCEYCFSSSKSEHPYASLIKADDCRDFFDKTCRRWHFHFSGGEPFFAPGFVELCQALSERHVVSVNSNLSTNNVLCFADGVDPARVEFIHCSLQIEERIRHEGLAELLKKIDYLTGAGFPVFSSCVMTPDAFSIFPEIQSVFHRHKVPLFPKAMRAIYRGRPYPFSYTVSQRREFKLFSAAAEALSVQFGCPKNPMINLPIDAEFLDGFPDFQGVMCSAGVDSVTIGPDGAISRCGSGTMIGSLREKRLELLSEPRPCDQRSCPYVCMKHTGLSVVAAQQLPRETPLMVYNPYTHLNKQRPHATPQA